MAVNLIEDVTETKRNEIAQRLMARTARTLAEASSPSDTLQAIADAAVPGLADWAGVDLVDATGRIQTRAIAHRDPDKVRLGWELRARWPPTADEPEGLGAVDPHRGAAARPRRHRRHAGACHSGPGAPGGPA